MRRLVSFIFRLISFDIFKRKKAPSREDAAPTSEGEIMDELTLFDLPQDVIIDIISQKCITVEVRKNLRATCKTMESIVAQSDFKRHTILEVRSDHRGKSISERQDNMTWDVTSFERLIRVPDNEHMNAMCRLYRRIHYWKIVFRYFNFKREKQNGGEFGVNQLLQYSNNLACDKLTVFVDKPNYEPRMFDVIGNILIRQELEMQINSIKISKTHLENMPAVPSLILSSHDVHSQLSIDSGTLLYLIAKHHNLTIKVKRFTQLPETLLEARKIITEFGHTVVLNLEYSVVEAALELIGVTINEDVLRSSHSAANANVVRNGAIIKYNINYERSIISFDRLNSADRVDLRISSV